MDIIRGLPVLSSRKLFNDQVKDKLLFTVNFIESDNPEKADVVHATSNQKFNEPPKVFSTTKESGIDYFGPVMKYRGC